MIAPTPDNNPTGSTDDCSGNTATATCCPHCETVDEEEIKLEHIRVMREFIKEQSRIACYFKPVIPGKPFMGIEPIRRLSTNTCPKRHYKTHNHPTRFKKESL